MFSFVITLFIGIQSSVIQTFASKLAGGYLSQKTGAEIKIGQFIITPSMMIKISDVQVKDLRDNNLIAFKTLKLAPRIKDIVNNNIHIKSVEIDSLDANLVRYKGEKGFNFSFFSSVFGSNKEKDKKDSASPVITIDRVKLRGINFEYWHQDKSNTKFDELHSMDYAHINVYNIDIDAYDVCISDGVKCNLSMLKAVERTGFEIQSLSSLVDVSSKGIILDSLNIITNNSVLDLDLHMLYNNFKAFNRFIDSVRFEAVVRQSDIMLSDIGHYAAVMYEMPDRFIFSGVMSGPVSDFTVKDIVFDFGNNTHFEGSVGFDGLPEFFDCDMFLNIDKMTFSYNDINNLKIPKLENGRIPLPEQLSILGKGRIKGHFRGTYYDFKADVNADTEAGKVLADITMSTDKTISLRSMSGNIIGNKILVGKIAKAEPTLGSLDINAKYKCEVSRKPTKLSVNGNALNVYLNGEKINNIYINGSLENKVFDGTVKVSDGLARLLFNGNVNFNKELKANFTANIDHIDLYKLHMSDDEQATIKTNIRANFSGNDIDKIQGEIGIDDLIYNGDKGHYVMKNLTASVVNDNLMQRKMKINCDFFDFEMGGIVSFAALKTSILKYVNHYSKFPYMEKEIEKSKYKTSEQDFYIKTSIFDASTICALFLPDLAIAKNTSLNGTFTTKSNTLNMTMRSDFIRYGNIVIDSAVVRNRTNDNTSILKVSAKSLLPTNANDSTTMGLDNIVITSFMTNDTIYTNIDFNGHKLPDRNKVSLKTKFKADNTAYGRFMISGADILIDNKKWTFDTDNYIDLRKDDRTYINNVSLIGDSQKLTINGYLPLQNSDTLMVDFNNIDISTADFATTHLGINIDGYINGNASISGIKQTLSIFANMTIDSLALNNDYYGDASIMSFWSNQDHGVHVAARIKDHDTDRLSLLGTYYPNKEYDNLEFRLSLDDLRLNVIEPFTNGIADRIKGYGSGRFDIIGSLKRPIIEGDLYIKDGGCRIDYLNTYYTFEPRIALSENLIEFENMTLTDSLGNIANVSGGIKHNYLKDLDFGIKLYLREFLAFATGPSNNADYYGTAFANGLVEITGPINNIKLNIKAATKKGTDVTIPLNGTQTVKSKDYIVFTNNIDDTLSEAKLPPKRSLFNIDLDLFVDNNASLHIILPGDIGTIDAAGNGNIKIGVAPDNFSLMGNYVIENGQFDLVLENILRKKFNLEKGGTISFSGDPLDGTINASGVYQCKASLGSAGIVTDSTSSRNNINVESVIYLRNKLLNPNITFGMRLPNASEDLQSSLFSVIDTTNQAVMTQQTISLLVLNSFSNSNNLLSDFNNGSFSVLTAQLNSWLSQISRNFDIGLNYKPGDDLSNEELQIALRTQLFNDYLTIESNFGFINQSASSNNSASSIVGEVDVYVKLTKSGNLTAHFYNHSNNNTNLYNYTYDKTAPYTQGLGISYNRSFDKFKDLFKKKNTTKRNKP